MSEKEKKDLVETLETCVALLDASGVNSKQIVKNTLSDIISDLKGIKNTENGLPF